VPGAAIRYLLYRVWRGSVDAMAVYRQTDVSVCGRTMLCCELRMEINVTDWKEQIWPWQRGKELLSPSLQGQNHCRGAIILMCILRCLNIVSHKGQSYQLTSQTRCYNAIKVVKHYWKTYGQYEVDAYMYFTGTIITFLHIL